MSQRKVVLETRELRPFKDALKMPKGKRIWVLSGKVSAGGEWGLQGGQEGLMMQSFLESLSKWQFLSWNNSPSPQQETVTPRH